MEIFVAVADNEGFAAAARRLRASPASVTRAVAALEAHLGARLLSRTTRTVRLTDAGARFLADARRLLEQLRDAEAEVVGQHREPRGRLTITAPRMFGRLHVAPIVSDLVRRHAELSVRLVLLDRVVNLVEEGIDAAVRIGELPSSGLYARRVGAVRRVLCAAPRYLRRRGRPRAPADLERHDGIEFSDDALPRAWLGSARPRTRFFVNSAEVAIDAAIEGRGLVRVLSYQVAAALAAGTLVEVLADAAAPAIPVHVVHIEGRSAPARVRVFVDDAAQRLHALPVLRER